MAKIPQNVYSNMEFAPYQYREYPKYMGKDNITKKDIIVNSAAEEAEYLEGKRPKNLVNNADSYKANLELDANPEGFGKNSGSEKQVKKELLEAALALGIKAKGTWGIKKLQDAINSSESM